MKGMHFGHGTGSALKLFGLFGGGKQEEEKTTPPPPEVQVVPKQDKTNVTEKDDSNESTEVKDSNVNESGTKKDMDFSSAHKAGEEYQEQNLVYGQSNPNAQEVEDTIGESTRSVISRSKKFNKG